MLQAFVIPAYAEIHYHNRKSKGHSEAVAVTAFFCVAKPAPFCVRRADKHKTGSAQDGNSYPT
ncbi:MAG: hypothetical protein M3Z05_21535, partial [Gemmatimonadota bacterium]|nr:hypothetical protein [Gemmatimonadota bacterium]